MKGRDIYFVGLIILLIILLMFLMEGSNRSLFYFELGVILYYGFLLTFEYIYMMPEE